MCYFHKDNFDVINLIIYFENILILFREFEFLYIPTYEDIYNQLYDIIIFYIFD